MVSGVYDTAMSRSTTAPVSLASLEMEKKKSVSLQSIREKAKRSFSRESNLLDVNTDERPGSRHSRRLSRSAAFELLSRRNSGFSDDYSSVSRTPTTISLESTSSVDFRSQSIQSLAPLVADAQLFSTKTPYLVVTSGYITKLKSYADVTLLFPRLEQGEPPSTPGRVPKPLLAIPISQIVTVFPADHDRHRSSIEVWWRGHETTGFRHALFSFSSEADAKEQLDHILSVVRASSEESADVPRCPWEVECQIRKIYASEEREYQQHDLDIFPVVPRGGTRRGGSNKSEERLTRFVEGHSFYLAIGANMCFYLEISKASNNRRESSAKHSSFGLVTLERFNGSWTPYQEKFDVTFRDPFQPPVTLELASRHYRQIIRVLGKADRYLKPAWPSTWQSLEIFRVSGLKEPQYLVPRGNYGSVHRTLDAYLSAYRCGPVEWEVNWKPQFAPEFRLLPPKDGGRYSPRQLLAVLRALRYNDYFRSLSFRGVDLSVVHNCFDYSSKQGSVAYLDRNCIALAPDEIESLQLSPILHKEVHALAFCAQTIRQIDFGNSFVEFPARAKSTAAGAMSLQFLTPVLNLLETDSTKCNHLILSGNSLTRADIQNLRDVLVNGRLQGLDVSRCNLSDMDLRDLFEAVGDGAGAIQVLNMSGNPGRVPSRTVPRVVESCLSLRELNLCGSLSGDSQGPLISFAALRDMCYLEELDLSHCKINGATLDSLERYLLFRAQALESGEKGESSFRRLVLNSCGLNGQDVARLFDAIGRDHGVHLFLSGNPIEDGVEYLVRSIRNNLGPAGLHMDMVEFTDERNYTSLIKALTSSKHLSLLSLVGTAPTPSPDVPCSRETLEALEDLLAKGKSITHLDLSGYSGRLDEGQLARGLTRALRGLTKNRTLTHLWVRNQNLHSDVGTLATVLRENRSLKLLDCQDNGFDLADLRTLVRSISESRSITDFPVSAAEKGRIWASAVGDLARRQTSKVPRLAARNRESRTEAALREELEQQVSDLNSYLSRNRTLHAEEQGPDRASSAGGMTLDGASHVGWQTSLQADGGGTDSDEPAEQHGGTVCSGTVYSSATTVVAPASPPYHIQLGDGLESPAEAASPIPTLSVNLPGLASLDTTEDELLRKVLENFKENGFGEL